MTEDKPVPQADPESTNPKTQDDGLPDSDFFPDRIPVPFAGVRTGPNLKQRFWDEKIENLQLGLGQSDFDIEDISGPAYSAEVDDYGDLPRMNYYEGAGGLPLTVYVDENDYIKVRNGYVVWTQTVPVENIQMVDPVAQYSPVKIPPSGSVTVAVRMVADHAGERADSIEDGNCIVEVRKLSSVEDIYLMNTSDNGAGQLERWWVLATVNSHGGVSPRRQGGDILELRQG